MTTIDEQIACVRRDLETRRRVYAQWVETRRLEQAHADREIAAMEAVLATLVAVKEGQEPAPL